MEFLRTVAIVGFIVFVSHVMTSDAGDSIDVDASANDDSYSIIVDSGTDDKGENTPTTLYPIEDATVDTEEFSVRRRGFFDRLLNGRGNTAYNNGRYGNRRGRGQGKEKKEHHKRPLIPSPPPGYDDFLAKKYGKNIRFKKYDLTKM